jgi:hypothetical protein
MEERQTIQRPREKGQTMVELLLKIEHLNIILPISMCTGHLKYRKPSNF